MFKSIETLNWKTDEHRKYVNKSNFQNLAEENWHMPIENMILNTVYDRKSKYWPD